MVKAVVVVKRKTHGRKMKACKAGEMAGFTFSESKGSIPWQIKVARQLERRDLSQNDILVGILPADSVK
jgi:S-adenosylmethionine synthetase